MIIYKTKQYVSAEEQAVQKENEKTVREMLKIEPDLSARGLITKIRQQTGKANVSFIKRIYMLHRRAMYPRKSTTEE